MVDISLLYQTLSATYYLITRPLNIVFQLVICNTTAKLIFFMVKCYTFGQIYKLFDKNVILISIYYSMIALRILF